MEGIPPSSEARLRANLDAVRGRIVQALDAADRPRDAARLVAVTKAVDAATTRALIALGQVDLGENRPESLREKVGRLGPEADGVRWHMIGHYQRRKVRDTLELVHCVHSVHSERLLEALDARAAELGRRTEILIQVNVSGEANKQGFRPDDVPAALEGAKRSANLSVQGLMTMAPVGLASADLRRVFAGLRDLRDRCATPDAPLPELSMGMSGDFEEAIREGATLVRVGSALYDGVRSG